MRFSLPPSRVSGVNGRWAVRLSFRKGILGRRVSWPKGKQTGTKIHRQRGPQPLLPPWNVGICQIVLVLCFVLFILQSWIYLGISDESTWKLKEIVLTLFWSIVWCRWNVQGTLKTVRIIQLLRKAHYHRVQYLYTFLIIRAAWLVSWHSISQDFPPRFLPGISLLSISNYCQHEFALSLSVIRVGQYPANKPHGRRCNWCPNKRNFVIKSIPSFPRGYIQLTDIIEVFISSPTYLSYT